MAGLPIGLWGLVQRFALLPACMHKEKDMKAKDPDGSPSMLDRRDFLTASAFTVVSLSMTSISAIAQTGSPHVLAATHTLEFETTEVMRPALSVAPDGRSFVFNLLGHLFRLPASGGEATQLTFGNYYDSDPAFSPDGTRIAFVSNRDGSDGNIFLLEISNGKVSQLTHDFQTLMPAWSPDGKTIAYVSILRRAEYPLDRIPMFGNGDTGRLSTVSFQGGAPARLSDPRAFGSLFYLPDGRLAWTTVGRGAATIEVRTAEGTIHRLASLPEGASRLVFHPKGDGFYYVAGGNLQQHSFQDAEPKTIGPIAEELMLMGIARDSKAIYAAADAKLWRIDLPRGVGEQIRWRARVKMEVVAPSVRKWTPPANSKVDLAAVLTPRVSPNGSVLIFMAAGFLWEQPLKGGQAKRVIDEHSFQLDPAFSPDGKELAFVSDMRGKRELRILDLATRRTRTIASLGDSSWALSPIWSHDGKSVVYQRADGLGAPYRFMRVDAGGTGQPVELARGGQSWDGRPHLSADGKFLYYTARMQHMANLYRLPLQPNSKPEAVTDLKHHVSDALVSPDGNWVAFRRNSEIWLARMQSRLLKDEDFHCISINGGRSYAFTTDSSAIVYAKGPCVWRREIQGKQATEIPIRLALQRATAVPLLISRVRVLDFQQGEFSAETSMLVEQGRIRWIGSESGRSLPANVVKIDAGGRYAIPGIMDAHVHAAWTNQQISEDSLIAYGVTSVRDVGSRLDLMKALQNRGDATDLPVPRYFASGDIFEDVMPLWGNAFLEIATPEDARSYVQRFKAEGADMIKVYGTLAWHLKSEAAAEAKRLGMPIVGHGLNVEEIVRSVNFGISSLEHTTPNSDDIIKLVANAGTWLCPTPTVFTAGTPLKLADPTTLDEKFRTYNPDGAIKAAGFGRAVPEGRRAGWKNTLGTFLNLHKNGVKLVAGTDALMGGVFFGPSVHWVLEWYSEAGIPAIDVLRMATLNAAEAVGASEDLGSLAPGKIADIVLLDADPLADMKNTMKIWRVLKDGHVFDPATMRQPRRQSEN
jgi:imidazolonepropionase-like amidohydrolase/Tol biopolymer transport system component